jgi:hypothetical protein
VSRPLRIFWACYAVAILGWAPAFTIGLVAWRPAGWIAVAWVALWLIPMCVCLRADLKARRVR